MRLSSEQIDAFHKVLKIAFALVPYSLFLYGSRTNDQLKGGDIDLLIVTTDEGVKVFNSHELNLLVQIKKQPVIGQRRIDLKVVTEKNLKTDAFLKEIAKSMIILVGER